MAKLSPKPEILLISADRDFSETVAEQVRRELSLVCNMADNQETAKTFIETAALVVTDEKNGKYLCPVLGIDRAKAPLRLHELLAEIENTLQKQNNSDALPLGPYELQLRAKQLVHNATGKAIDLTDKEVQLLQTLAEAGNKGIAKEQLLKQVWGFDNALDTHTLETHIYRLRGKFRELADDDMIAAYEGGYRLEIK